MEQQVGTSRCDVRTAQTRRPYQTASDEHEHEQEKGMMNYFLFSLPLFWREQSTHWPVAVD